MKKIIVLSACFLMAFGIMAFAQEQDVEQAISESSGPEHNLAIKEKLGLSNEQAKKMKEIKENLGNEMRSLVKERNQLTKEIKAMMKETEVDLGKVESKVKDLERVRTRVFMARLSAAKQSDKILTKEQKEKMKEIRKERKKGEGKKGKRPLGKMR